MAKASAGIGKGLIQGAKGGDRWGYLGHFRGEKVAKEGHNQGAPPVGPAPVTNRNMAAPAPTTPPPMGVNRNITPPPAPVNRNVAAPPAPVTPPPVVGAPVNRNITAPVAPPIADAGVRMAPAAGGVAPATRMPPLTRVAAALGGTPRRQTAQFRGRHQVAAARQDVRAARKMGGDVGAAKAELAGAKTERKAAFGAIKSARKAVKTAKPGEGRKAAARETLKEAKESAKSRFAGRYKARGGK